MKLLGRCTRIRCYYPRYHPSHYSCHPKFFCYSSRRMATGLFFVSAKPLALHPNASATMAINNLLRGANRQLQIYDVMQRRTQSCPPSLALSLIDDLVKVKEEGAHSLQSLPQLPKDSIHDESETRGRSESPQEGTSDNDELELPPELQPILQDDGFTPLPDGEEATWDDSDTPPDYDALDLENTPDFDHEETISNTPFLAFCFPRFELEPLPLRWFRQRLQRPKECITKITDLPSETISFSRAFRTTAVSSRCDWTAWPALMS